MKRMLVAMILAMGALFVAAPVAHSDEPQACNWVTTNHGANNNVVLLNGSLDDVYLDYLLQLRTASGCAPQLRGAFNYRCTHASVPSNCQVIGQLHLTKNMGAWTSDAFNSFAGSDGVGTVYTTFYTIASGNTYRTQGYFTDVYVNGAPRGLPDGFYGASRYCSYAGGSGMSCP